MDNPSYHQEEAVIATVDESDFPTKFFQTVLRQHSDAASTALHLLIDQWTEDGLEERRWKYFNSLLSTPNVNVNAVNTDGISLLESTVNKHQFKLARKLLDIGAVVPNQRVRQIMQEYMASIMKGSAKIDKFTISDPEEELWKTLFENNEDKFQALLESNTCGNQGNRLRGELNLSVPNRNCTMLQYACQMEMVKVVECLLAAGVEPFHTTLKNSTPPLVSAAIQGNEKILLMLINAQGIFLDAVEDDVLRQTALHKITVKLIEANANDRPRYGRCLELLLTKSVRYQQKQNKQISSDNEVGISINVNAKDIHGNSPLHYAAMSGVEDAVIALINNGAYLGLRNLQGEIPIKWILPSTLKQILDSNIRLNGDRASSRDFSITFDYSLLLKPRRLLPLRNRKTPSITQHVNNSQDAKITLGRKQRDSVAPTAQREKIYPECEGVLLQLSRSPPHYDLLKHPLINSFLALKWHTVYTIYWFNLFLFCVFLAVLTAYTVVQHKSEKNEADKNALPHLWWYIIVYLAADILKQASQILMVPMRVLTSFSFYVQIAMLGFTIAILPHYENPDDCRHYSAAAVLLGWSKLMLSLGHHPRSIPITIFAHVLKTFIWLLFWYSPLLIGFCTSFLFIFGGSTNKEDSDNKTSDDAGNTNKTEKEEFKSFELSMVKLSTMVIGEFEYSNLPFDKNPFYSRIILVLFVFLVAIVMINLLNGMAVSDTHKLRCKAETIGNVRKVQLISYLETLNMMSIFNSHSNWSPFTFILRKCPNTSVFRILRTSSLAMQRHKLQAICHQRLTDNGNNQGVILGKILRCIFGLFFNSSSMVMCLSDKTYTIYPHHKLGDPKRQKQCACHTDFEMDSKILRAAVERVQKSTLKMHREADWNVSPLALLMD